MTGTNLDSEILLTLNSLAGNQELWKVSHNSLFRAFPISFALVALWFVDDCRKRRSRMLVGLLAVCMATPLSLWLQFHLNVHTRPFLEPGLPLIIADPNWTANWDRTSSFPSDTATLFFGLCAVVFAERRVIGTLCFLWATVMIAVPRIIFGWHYPTDIIGSAILGAGCVFIFHKIPYLQFVFERVLNAFEGRMQFVHAILFIFLADAFNLFEGLQQAERFLVRLTHAL